MDYKTILVHCDASKAAPHRLSVAVGLARRFNAHLVGLYARPQFDPPMLFDGGFSIAPYLSAFEKSVTADRSAAHEAYTQAIAGAGLSTEWRSVNGFVTLEIIDAAHHADIVVVSQAESDATQGMPVPGRWRMTWPWHPQRQSLLYPVEALDRYPAGKSWSAGRSRRKHRAP